MGTYWGSLSLRVGRAGIPDPNLRRISLIWRQTAQIRRGDRRCTGDSMWEGCNTITHKHQIPPLIPLRNTGAINSKPRPKLGHFLPVRLHPAELKRGETP